MRVGVLVLALGGCDQLFKLDHIDLDPDARSDAASDAFDLEANCPSYDLVLFPGSRYRIIPLNATAWAMSDDCANDTDGFSHLAVAQTRAELDELVSSLATKQQGRWWLGLVQSSMASTPIDGWIWLTGEPVDAGLWYSPIEPNDGDGLETGDATMHDEQFAFIQQDRPGLIDVRGSIAELALCECDGRAVSDEAAIAIDQARM